MGSLRPKELSFELSDVSIINRRKLFGILSASCRLNSGGVRIGLAGEYVGLAIVLCTVASMPEADSKAMASRGTVSVPNLAIGQLGRYGVEERSTNALFP